MNQENLKDFINRLKKRELGRKQDGKKGERRMGQRKKFSLARERKIGDRQIIKERKRKKDRKTVAIV